MAFVSVKEVRRDFPKHFLEDRGLSPFKVARDASMLSDMCEAINKVYAKELKEAVKRRNAKNIN